MTGCAIEWLAFAAGAAVGATAAALYLAWLAASQVLAGVRR